MVKVDWMYFSVIDLKLCDHWISIGVALAVSISADWTMMVSPRETGMVVV